ncbi:MAG: tetratricopeptide repeat protein [bacterium]
MEIVNSLLTGSFGTFNKLREHEKFPKVQGLMEYANKCYSNGKKKDAIREYNEALRMYECVELYNNLALIYDLEKKPEKAIENFEKALKLAPDSSMIRYNLGRFYYINRDMDKAIACFQAIIAWAEKQEKLADEDKIWIAFAYNDLGCAHYRKNDTEKALEFFKKSFATESKFLSAQNNIASIYASQKNVDEAIAEYNKIIEKDKNFAEAYNGLGVISFERNEIKKAVEYFEKAYEVDPYCQIAIMNLQTLFKMAQAHQQRVKTQEAVPSSDENQDQEKQEQQK